MSTVAQRAQLGPYFSGGTLQGAAKCYHYEAGTSTLQNIWSDRGQTTTLAQPFVADANGIFNFFADGLYKLIICGPNSTGPSVDVLHTLDNFAFLDPTDPTFDEGTSITSASAISVGPEIWAHITGSTNIDTISGTIPFFWAVFDGNLTLNYSSGILTPASINLAVRQNDVALFLNEGSGIWRVAAHYHHDGLLVATQDGRTATVDVPLTIRSTTSGTPAAGIGTGLLYQAESADEVPSDAGQTECAFTDVGAGTEDSYFQVLLRVAGAALTAVYRFGAMGAFKAIFTHANSADRTYTLPNFNWDFITGTLFKGPTLCGTGSTRGHEAVFSSATGNLSGIHFYSDFTLSLGHTLTVPTGKRRLIIVATETITINGTISAVGAGAPGGGAATKGSPGTDQAGGGSGSSAAPGGDVEIHGAIYQAGGATGSDGTNGTHLAGSDVPLLLDFLSAMGGAGGGGNTGGGPGGGSIVLIAPTIILASSAVLNTSSTQGVANVDGFGGAGNVYIACRSYTDGGATFTMSGGTPFGASPFGGKGADGVKQINIYN